MATSRRRNMSSDLCARGFTLIEVIVALTLGAVIVLGARELIENLASGATRIAAEARTISANANGEWFVRSLAGRSFGSLADIFSMTLTRASGTFGLTSRRFGRLSRMCARMIVDTVPSKGGFLATMW